MLNQFALVNAKLKEKPYKLTDGSGLYAFITPTGSKLWRLKYSYQGKDKTLALGAFPAITLLQARTLRDDARKLLAQGIDPSQARKEQKAAGAIAAANTFKAIAEEWLEKQKAEGAAHRTLEKNRWLLLDVASPIGPRPVTEVKPVEILDLLRKVEKSGRRETAHRARGLIGTVFRYAIVTLRAEIDPSAPLKEALLKRNVVNRAAITDEKQLGALMTSIDEYDGWLTIRAAIQLLALTMVRPGEIRGMRKAEIDRAAAVWRIPADRMKMRRPHDVPLSRQALAILDDIWPLAGPELVLPSIRSNRRPLSENAMNSALRRMGYSKDEMTSHGFRSSASTVLNERGFDPDVIEAALAHQDEREVRRVYNRARYWPQRVALMQEWADLLDDLKLRSTRKAA